MMIACVVCDKPCIPMADWDAPVCRHCDERVEAILTLAETPIMLRQRAASPEFKLLFDRLRVEIDGAAA